MNTLGVHPEQSSSLIVSEMNLVHRQVGTDFSTVLFQRGTLMWPKAAEVVGINTDTNWYHWYQSDCLCTYVFNKRSPSHQKKHSYKAEHLQRGTNISSMWTNVFSLPVTDWTIPQRVKLLLSNYCSGGWVYPPRDFLFLSALSSNSLLNHWCSSDGPGVSQFPSVLPTWAG